MAHHEAQSVVVFDGSLTLLVVEDSGLVDSELCAAIAAGWLPFKLTDVTGEPVLVMPHRITHVRTAESVKLRSSGAVSFTTP